MPSEVTYTGQHGSYKIHNQHPFAYGRISVLFEGLNDHQELVCIKSFRDTPSVGDESLLGDFMRELRAQQTLKHSHILPILDFGEGIARNSAPFLVLPLCKEGNLRQLMRSRDFMPVEQALTILEQIALAVDFAHKMGFVHGDIKPENILFSDNFSQAYLCDFGMSKYFSITEQVTTAPTFYGGGSSAYLSPEQLDQGKQTPSSDIYSFGIVAFEMLTGQLPFDVKVPPIKQMVLKIEGKLFDPQDINPRISDAVKAALLQALQVNSKDRPGTASEFCQMFSKAETKSAVKGQPRRILRFWNSLEPVNKVAIITAIIAALAGVLAAVIKLIPVGEK